MFPDDLRRSQHRRRRAPGGMVQLQTLLNEHAYTQLCVLPGFATPTQKKNAFTPGLAAGGRDSVGPLPRTV